MLKPLPIGVQTFEGLINGGYLYIDKTEYIYSLIENTRGYYFLSRPRRFGKSLLISTLDAIFQGKKELFRDLWIKKADYDWQEYPVIRLDFTKIENIGPIELQQSLIDNLVKIGNEYELTLEEEKGIKYLFSDLIEKLSLKNKVVILVDEYDKPIIDNITNPDIAKENRDILKSFYGILKGTDAHLRFLLLTGVTKFSHVSVFSDLNNLDDITTVDEYAGMMGCTQQELESYFAEYIKHVAEKYGQEESKIKEKILDWYNGYRFSDSDIKVYNPFSLLLLFKHKRFKNYWFETGTPSFLINIIKEKGYDLSELDTETVSEDVFSSYQIEDMPILPLLFQTGYLTIKDYYEEENSYKLYYPNFEVEQSFLRHLATGYSKIEKAKVNSYLLKSIKYLKQKKHEEFFNTLKIFFANIDYDLHIKQEKYYQTIFYVIFKLIGLKVGTEIKTNAGRIDAVIELEDSIYIFEFKLDDTAENALKQVYEKEYYQKYSGTDKEIVCVGVEFNYEKKNIGRWIVG